MGMLWKKKLHYQGKPEVATIYISRGVDRWWVNSHLFGYWDFNTYCEAERFFLQLTKAIERASRSLPPDDPYEEFRRRLTSLRVGRKVLRIELPPPKKRRRGRPKKVVAPKTTVNEEY